MYGWDLNFTLLHLTDEKLARIHPEIIRENIIRINITKVWYIGQLRRLPPRHQKTPWRQFFVHKWRACEDDDYLHASCNDKDVPQSSRRPESGKASHSDVCQQRSKKWAPFGCSSESYDFCEWLDQSEDE